MNRYHLRTCDMDDARLREYAAIASGRGMAFAFLSECLPQEVEAIYWLHQECRKRQPPVETRQVPQEYARWYETFVSPPANPELYGILRNGNEGIGVSCLVPTEIPSEFLCGFTGMLAQYAKHGLALALKSHLLRKAKEQGIESVVTQVRTDNLPMRRINERLGFAPVKPTR